MLGTVKLFVGDSVLVEPLVRDAIEEVVPGDLQNLDLEVIRPSERSLDDAIGALHQIGMFSKHRCVWVRDFVLKVKPPPEIADDADDADDDGPGEGSGGGDKKKSAEPTKDGAPDSDPVDPEKSEEERESDAAAALKRFEEFVIGEKKALPEDTTLLISSVDLNKNTKFYKWFKNKKLVVELREKTAGNGAPAKGDGPGWRHLIAPRIVDAGLAEPSADVVKAIIGRAGDHAGELLQEVDRICSALPQGSELDLDYVRACMRDLSTAWVFDLTKAIGARDLGTATQLLDALFRGGSVPQQILPTLASHIYELREARILAGELPRAVVSANNGKKFVYDIAPEHPSPWLQSRNPWRAWFLMQEARNFGVTELHRLYTDLHQIDLAMKSSPLPPTALLNRFLQSACLARPKAGR